MPTMIISDAPVAWRMLRSRPYGVPDVANAIPAGRDLNDC